MVLLQRPESQSWQTFKNELIPVGKYVDNSGSAWNTDGYQLHRGDSGRPRRLASGRCPLAAERHFICGLSTGNKEKLTAVENYVEKLYLIANVMPERSEAELDEALQRAIAHTLSLGVHPGARYGQLRRLDGPGHLPARPKQVSAHCCMLP